ncbi:MAG: DUF3883 domain-containing protein [Planctomycetes bacterium]|nr:DUF3883 domain-containing protein [Planctomycetota bacterium]
MDIGARRRWAFLLDAGGGAYDSARISGKTFRKGCVTGRCAVRTFAFLCLVLAIFSAGAAFSAEEPSAAPAPAGNEAPQATTVEEALTAKAAGAVVRVISYDRRGRKLGSLTLQGVERIASVLVLPHPERETPEVKHLRQNLQTEAMAMRVVMEHEKIQGREVTDVHEKNLGYDVTSLNINSGELRLIEVKSLGASGGKG